MRRALWFRRDLRAEDNPLLSFGGEVLALFIFDPAILGSLEPDDRRVGFLFEQLLALRERLRSKGIDLALFYGDPEAVFSHLVAQHGIEEVCASGDYDAYALERDRRVSMHLPFRRVRDTYIFEPDELLKNDGTPYLVFTPFYKRARSVFSAEHLQAVTDAPMQPLPFDYSAIWRVSPEGLEPLPLTPESIGFTPAPHGVTPLPTLLESLGARLNTYPKLRDRLDVAGTSELSAHLRFGTLGIRQLLRRLVELKRTGIDTEPFFRQLLFREFYAHMLCHFPALAEANFRTPFHGIPDAERFETFCQGRTGVPVVDAGVRQLVATGKMHNRARMICASFFTKELLLPWQWGEAFFARHLLDYDAASNILSWQWSAGTGIDPQPYFRIFNPYLQGKKFDPEGDYVRQWVPELRDLPASCLHDEKALFSQLPAGYPQPRVRRDAAVAAAREHFDAALRGS